MQQTEEEGRKTAAHGDGGEEGKAADRGGEDEGEDLRNTCGKKSTKPNIGSCPDQKCVPGIIYLGHIPPRLRPKHLRNMLSVYGEIGRIFLQPEGV